MTELLQSLVGTANVFANEPMRNHTSFRIGGAADFLVTPQSKDALCDTINTLRGKDIETTIIGNGSNLLVSDNGIRGVAVKISHGLSDIKVDGNVITAQSGALLSKLANAALSHGLLGLEFAAGIPGTVGGALVMNAGAYDGEMKDVTIATEFLDENGNIGTLQDKEHEFGYRTSRFQRENWVILQSEFQLQPGEPNEIRAKMDDFAQRRKSKQPLELPSAGSAFKRPVGGYAAKLIEDAGLKGFRIGGAAVSELHSGFIVNVGNATATDVRELLKHVQSKVFEKFGIMLAPEIKMIGEI